jgi:hypothetical protein
MKKPDRSFNPDAPRRRCALSVAATVSWRGIGAAHR